MSGPGSAPEVVDEHSGGTIASEVWSLGATVYSLLAGHSPFERREKEQNTRELMRRRIARATFVPIPRTDVPDALQQVLATAMTRDPDRRYPSARAFGEAIRDVQRAAGLAPTPLEVPTEEWMPASDAVDFTDVSARGPARSRVAEGRRRVAVDAAQRRTPSAEDDTTGLSASPARALWSPRVIALSILGGLVAVGGLLAAGAALWTVIR